MHVRFYVDPETDAPHIYKHGIDEGEVMDVLSAQVRIVEVGQGRA